MRPLYPLDGRTGRKLFVLQFPQFAFLKLSVFFCLPTTQFDPLFRSVH
jgi:hypothetical protein